MISHLTTHFPKYVQKSYSLSFIFISHLQKISFLFTSFLVFYTFFFIQFSYIHSDFFPFELHLKWWNTANFHCSIKFLREQNCIVWSFFIPGNGNHHKFNPIKKIHIVEFSRICFDINNQLTNNSHHVTSE